jgi:hypothetical protein
MWQCTQSGSDPAGRSQVDFNRYYGTEAQLRGLAVGAEGGASELTSEEDRWLKEIEQGIVVAGTTTVAQSFELLFNRVKAINSAFAVSGTTGPEQTWNILTARMANIAKGIQALTDAQAAPPPTGR